MEDKKFYFCEHCGKIIGLLEDPGVDTVCCGDVMKELVPHTTDAGNEKHLPVVSVSDQFVLDAKSGRPMQEYQASKDKVPDNVPTIDVESVVHPMQELTEAEHEKHISVTSVFDQLVTVDVGSVPHPMEAKHYIQWIYLQTKKGGQRKALKPGDAPKAVFALYDDEPVAAFSYCNLHGLWKTSL